MTTFRRQLPKNEIIRDENQLRAYFHRFAVGNRPKRVGCEIEWLTVDRRGKPVPFNAPNGSMILLRRLQKDFEWEAVELDGHTLGARKGEVVIGLEPGGQIEYSSAPHENLDSLFEEYLSVKADLAEARRGLDLHLLSLGVQPFLGRTTNLPLVPKKRYRALAARLARSGRLGHWMMKATASIQLNLDYRDEAEASEILVASALLSRWCGGIFSNSPIWKGRDSGLASVRWMIWRDTDPARCGLPRFMLQPHAGLAAYVRYALQVPVLLCDRCPDGAHPHTFAEWIRTGRHHRPTLADWDLHLTTLYPDVRIKPHVELRFIDALPDPLSFAAIAFFKGLLYDGSARRQILGASRMGRSLSPRVLFTMAGQGLERIGPGEGAFLSPLEQMVFEEKSTPARRTLVDWRSARSPATFSLQHSW